MRRHLLSAVLALAALVIAASARAADDDAFAPFREEFRVLLESLRASRGLLAEDRPVVEAFRARVEAFAAAHPDDAGAVAMVLQLSRWLKDDERVRAAYESLMELRPDDAEIAISWIDYQESRPDAAPDAVFDAYRRLAERFPGNVRFARGWAERLVKRMRYDEAATIMRSMTLDPATEPEALMLMAECLFAEHHFTDALALLETIPVAALQADQKFIPVKQELDRRLADHRQYVDLWTKEQELRAQEDSAGDLPIAVVETPKGRITFLLLENEAPNTVANFVSLAESGFYDGTRFHRFLEDFMIQGGDPYSREGTEPHLTPGTGGPGYTIKDEHLVEPYRRHFRDSVAMANTGRPSSGGSGFYFNHKPTPWLNGRHTVFGRVVEGLDVVRSLRQDDAVTAIRIERKRPHEYVPEKIAAAEPAAAPPPGATRPGG